MAPLIRVPDGGKLDLGNDSLLLTIGSELVVSVRFDRRIGQGWFIVADLSNIHDKQKRVSEQSFIKADAAVLADAVNAIISARQSNG